jgi:hypothetical protein
LSPSEVEITACKIVCYQKCFNVVIVGQLIQISVKLLLQCFQLQQDCQFEDNLSIKFLLSFNHRTD